MNDDKAKAKKKSVTVYLTEDEFFELQGRATRSKMRPNELARELIVNGQLSGPTNFELHETEIAAKGDDK